MILIVVINDYNTIVKCRVTHSENRLLHTIRLYYTKKHYISLYLKHQKSRIQLFIP